MFSPSLVQLGTTRNYIAVEEKLWGFVLVYELACTKLPACRRLLFPLLHAEKGCLRNAVANRVPASRWQGILFRINCEIIFG